MKNNLCIVSVIILKINQQKSSKLDYSVSVTATHAPTPACTVEEGLLLNMHTCRREEEIGHISRRDLK
jgi:hypothetical protein